MRQPKVFGIGFHKTGTTSLGAALRILGYRVTGPNAVLRSDLDKKALTIARRLARRHDAFRDNPWPVLYREFDVAYPDSKFILTWRRAEDWIRSVVDEFGTTSTPMREWVYDGVGVPAGNEEHYLARYRRHNREVRSYFAGRPDDLLELNISEGGGWEQLCPFLGHPIPPVPFPHLNNSRVKADRDAWRSRRYYPPPP